MGCDHRYTSSTPKGAQCRSCGMIGQWLLCGFTWYSPAAPLSGAEQLAQLEKRRNVPAL
jgi:hypothetical protein